MKRLMLILFAVIVFGTTITCTSKRRDIELLEQGKVLFFQEKYNEAIPYFSKAIRKNPKNDEAYAYRGFCQYWLESYDEALYDFSKSLDLNPINETALFGQARIRWNLEDYRLAYQEFNRLIQINPDHDKAFFHRGRAYFYQGDTIRGLNDLSIALEKDSCFIDAYYLFSSVLTAQKKYELADYYLELALNCKQKNLED